MISVADLREKRTLLIRIKRELIFLGLINRNEGLDNFSLTVHTESKMSSQKQRVNYLSLTWKIKPNIIIARQI